MNLQLPRGRLGTGLWKRSSPHHRPWKRLPRISPAPRRPHLGWEHFLPMCSARELSGVSSPSPPRSSGPELLPESESYLLSSCRALRSSPREKAAPRDETHRFPLRSSLLGQAGIFEAFPTKSSERETYFLAAGFQVTEVCPPLVYKAAQQLFRGPHPPGQAGIGKITAPPRQSAPRPLGETWSPPVTSGSVQGWH